MHMHALSSFKAQRDRQNLREVLGEPQCVLSSSRMKEALLPLIPKQEYFLPPPSSRWTTLSLSYPNLIDVAN